MKKIFAVALIGLVAAATLRGDIIPSFGGTSPGTGTNTVWNYSINITSDQQVTTGDFFTIYDFGPFISGSNTQPANWTFSSSLVTTPPTGTNPPDNPALANLTWTYTGSPTIPTSTLTGFSVAMATSVFQASPATKTGFFAAQGTRATGGTAGTKVNNVGQLPVPVPEPTTISLLAFAGVGAAWRTIRRRS